MNRSFRALCRRELTTYFFSPLAYVVWFLFLVMMGAGFSMLLEALTQGRAGGPFLHVLYGESLFFWLGMLVVVPVITMRLFAEEQRAGTMETLMTAPITDTQVVLAKFIGSLLFFALLWAPTAAYPFLLVRFAPSSGPVDIGSLVTSYMGIFLIGSFYISVGLLASSLTRNQVVAAMLSFSFLILFFLAGFLPYYVAAPGAQAVTRHVSAVMHMMEYSRGLFDTRPLILYVSLTSLSLFFTVKVLESRKWRA